MYHQVALRLALTVLLSISCSSQTSGPPERNRETQTTPSSLGVPISQAIPLHVSSASPLGVPAFRFFGHAQCDSTGNLYFRAGQILNSSQVVRLSPKRELLLYPLP